MNVVAVELGDRPTVMTKSRMFAPQGVKLMAEVMGHMKFADGAVIVLDWSNVTQRQPDEVAKPVVFVTAVKSVGERDLTVEVRLDVEDTFGRDELMADDFLMIIASMEKKMNDTIEGAKED